MNRNGIFDTRLRLASSVVLSALLGQFPSVTSLRAAPDPPIALLNVNVLPMDSERVLERQTVIIRDGRIAEIGPTDRTAMPARTLQIDARGKFLMPGLTDMHAHLTSPHELPLYLANGVTTVYNLSGRPAHVLWRDKIARGEMSGPTIYTCGPIIFRCENADEAKRVVEDQSRAGYDSIKIYNEVSAAAYPVLVETARSRKMLVVGHIPRAPGLKGVLKERQAIAHAEEYIYTFFKNNVEDESRIPEVVAATRAAELPVILTLVNFDHILRQAEDLPMLLAKPETKYLAPWALAAWQPGRNSYERRFKKPPQQQYLRKSLAFQKSLARELNRSGVRVLVGTDAMNPGVVPGFSVHEELSLMVESGFTPFEALRSATRYPGEILSSKADFGTVTVGKKAELLLLEKNPLEDVRHAEQPAGVVSHGRWLPGFDLRKTLDEVPQAYVREESKVKSRLETDTKETLRYLSEIDPFNNLAIEAAADLIFRKGLNRLKEFRDDSRRIEPDNLLAQELFLTDLGSHLLKLDRRREALEVLQWNTLEHPHSASAWSSLAEAHLADGNKEKAAQLYRKSLAIDPNLTRSAEALKKLAP